MRKINLFLPVVLAFAITLGLPNWLSWNERVVLSTVLVMLWWWISEVIPMAVTALIPILVFPISNVMSMEKVVVPYADKFVFLFLGGFLLALAIEKHGLHKRIAFTADVFYANPWVDMHNRMKEALVIMGKIPRAVVRPPLMKISESEILKIKIALENAGLLVVS